MTQNRPQLENGYARIANELLEALARIRIPGEAMQVLWVIIRKTYGFGKKTDQIALSQFVAATGLSKPAVSRALKKLLFMAVIKKDNRNIVTYSISKDFSTWKPLSKRIIVINKVAHNRYNNKKGTHPLLKGFRFFEGNPTIADALVEKLVEDYGAEIVRHQLNLMERWLLANPKRKKKEYGRFISNWFKNTKSINEPTYEGPPLMTEEERIAWYDH